MSTGQERAELASEMAKAEINPITYKVKIKGTTPVAFHQMNESQYVRKQKLNKAEKKLGDTAQDIEEYAYRDAKGNMAIPSHWLKAAIVAATKGQKSKLSAGGARTDYLSSLFVDTKFASLGKKKWDFVHSWPVTMGGDKSKRVFRRVPAIKKGWTTTFDLTVLQPLLISGEDLHKNLKLAGQYCGIGECRVTGDFGRFNVESFREI